MNKDKLIEGRCESFNSTFNSETKSIDYVPCFEQGIRRYDNGLDCGIHCIDHWQDMIEDARRNSG